MIKCDFCEKKIEHVSEVFQLEITKWNSDGDGSGTGNFGDYHEGCAKKIITKTKKFCQNLKCK